MNLDNFILKFAEQFDETEMELFSAETNFRDLDEWSSLITLGLIAMADEDFGVKLTGEDIRKSQTIGDLYNIIITK